MKGSIGAKHNVEGGAIFWFTVSFLTSEHEHVRNYPKKKKFHVPPKFPNARILVVDDNAINFNVAVRILKQLGYLYISTAINGLDAVEIAGKEKLDLILINVQMPLMDGYEATKSIRKNNKTIPIIAMTANA